ncbi:MAG TPA: LysM domain-containing protein [Gaiellales bacterium]|jgi:LysM repeat protein|nr:LysM domain-containing protein [Gaiellales bacterium]
MTDRSPRRKKRRPKRPPGYRSPWAWLAPAALLGAVTVIVLILSSAGVIGHTSDGGLPASTLPGGTVETLPVPNTPPPPEPAPPPPPPLPPPAPPATATNTTTTTATTTGTSSSTTPSTTATTAQSTTATTTTTSTQATTTSDGQHVKWTVQRGDTLFSIATQFQTSVKELRRLNPGIDPSALQVGQTLVVR